MTASTTFIVKVTLSRNHETSATSIYHLVSCVRFASSSQSLSPRFKKDTARLSLTTRGLVSAWYLKL
jgi:hypothetical protein